MIYLNPWPYLVAVVLLIFCCSPLAAQEKPAAPSAENTAKAEAVVNRAIEVLGGNTYLNVRTVVGRGFYTFFADGISQIPSRFVDYIVYPDKERTEFRGDGILNIQTNAGDSGWLFDGATRSLSDMKPNQIEDFKRGMRTSVENLLHGWWKKEKATLSYVGRREAGLARRNDTVRLTYPNGFWVEYEFAVKEGLPEKVIYKKTEKKPDSEETVENTEEDRLQKPIAIAGVTAPWVIDHFTNGVQTSRINYESIEYNSPIADSLLAKPTDIKKLK
jgi:hypothetical protein